MHGTPTTEASAKRHRPRRMTVFVAAFLAGAAAAVGINRALDVHLAQRKPQVESEPIFVALRSLPQGTPVTVWDVALRDWPKAMLPTSAMRAHDSFEGCLLRHPLREGQPLLRVQLITDGLRSAAAVDGPAAVFAPPVPAVTRPVEADLWTPAPATAAVRPDPKPLTPAPAAAAEGGGVAVTSPDIASPALTATVVAPSAALPVADVGATAAVTDVAAATAPTAPPAPVAATAAVVAPSVPDEAGAFERTAPLPEEPPPPGPPSAAVADLPTVEDPEAVVEVGEPTPADPLPGRPSPTDVPPAVGEQVESVVVTRSAAPPADATTPAGAAAAVEETAATPDGPRQPRDGVVRYLVVPERIALQADSGFATPSPQPPAATAGRGAEQEPQMLENLPAVAGQTSPQATRSRQPQAGQRAAQQPAPKAGKAQPQPPSRQSKQRRASDAPSKRPTTAATSRDRGGWFPNITAGIDALTGRGRTTAAGADYDEAVATDDPTYRQR